MIRLYQGGEPNLRAYAYRALLGPAHLLDGVVLTVTLGFVIPRFSLEVARRLGFTRMNAKGN